MHEGNTIHQLMEMVYNYCCQPNAVPGERTFQCGSGEPTVFYSTLPTAADLDRVAEEEQARQATMRANLLERALD